MKKSNPEKIKGKKFGMLTALAEVPGLRTTWLFKCKCGEKKKALLQNVKAGLTRSCGCLRYGRGKK